MLKYSHLGIPTQTPRPGETYLPAYKLYTSGYKDSPYRIEWMRFEPGCPLPEIVQTVPHVAFEVDDLAAAIQGKKIIIEPNSPSEGVRVAFIEENGAPIELMQVDTLIKTSVKDDAGEILQLQKLAYQSEAAIYNDYTIAPLTQTLSDMEADLQKQMVLKAVNADRIIGSVRGYVKDSTGYIGRLMVHPDFQGQGLGSRLMQAIEERLNEAQRFELFTGHRSERNLYLYRKLGYRVCRREKASDQLTIVYLEKKECKL